MFIETDNIMFLTMNSGDEVDRIEIKDGRMIVFWNVEAQRERGEKNPCISSESLIPKSMIITSK